MIVEFIKENPVKIVLVFILALCIYGVNVDPNIVNIPIKKSFEYDGIYYNISTSNEIYRTTKPINNGVHSYYEVSPIKIFSGVGLFVISLVLLIGTLISDRDVNWNLDEVVANYYKKKVKMYKEDSVYYYYLNGKLLCKSNHLKESVSVDRYLENKNLLEDYIPKQVKRDSFLKSLLN
jgi:hypothetical protein